MKKRATVEDVVSCIKCNRWNEEKVKAKFGGKEYITVEDVLSCKGVNWYDKVWVMSQVFFQQWSWYCFEILDELSIKPLTDSSLEFQPLTKETRQKLFRKIKRQAKEEGLM